MELSITQTVAQVLRTAERPLTVDEVLARVRMLRPVDTAKPEVTVRNTFTDLRLVATLGGRPARYVWWPPRLLDNRFRQPLAAEHLVSGQVILNIEVRFALWPTFFADRGWRSPVVMLVTAEGVAIPVQIEIIRVVERFWRFLPNPTLAGWLAQQGALPGDDLIVRVVDVAEHRYAIELARAAGRDEAAMAVRNRALADAAAAVTAGGHDNILNLDLVPRLIAREVYRDPLAPDPLEEVLRADGRFVVSGSSIWLAEKTVMALERSMQVPPDVDAADRPEGDYRVALARGDEVLRRAWGEYLFDRGMDHRWAKWNDAAEAYYREALRLDPGHADAWVHLGHLRFAEDRVRDALVCYERGEAAALVRTIGDPQRYAGPFWLDVDSRPYLRALHGKGLCLWRLGQASAAREVFAKMRRLNPHDNQGVRFLISDLDAGMTWEESRAHEESTRAGGEMNRRPA